jgi:GT2 family glycosyltransferase
VVDPTASGVSFVVPVYDGERTLEAALAAILAEVRDRPAEVLVVDDGSSDGSRRVIERHLGTGRVELLQGEGRGAAAAINQGIRRARHEIVCQVDQDVVLDPGWLAALLAELGSGGDVAAAQGRYRALRGDGLLARVMALDLELRTKHLPREVDHVCTGNTAYRKSALARVGLFDESFGYGYDNCMSYRLGKAGYRLVFCPAATSVHRWRSRLGGYLAQQFGVAYGRLDLIARYPERYAGDQVSGPGMILHAAGTALAAAALGVGGLVAAAGGSAVVWLGLGAGLLALLAAERAAAGARAAWRSGDPAGLFFPGVHLLRDLAWVAALFCWLRRRVSGRARLPRHSMWRARA